MVGPSGRDVLKSITYPANEEENGSRVTQQVDRNRLGSTVAQQVVYRQKKSIQYIISTHIYLF